MSAPGISGALSLKETAEAVGLSADRWRKVWRAWSRDMAFPRPLAGGERGLGRRRPVANYAWDAEAVAAWKRSRSRCGLAPQPANEDAPPPPAPARAARDRAGLARLMSQGAGR